MRAASLKVVLVLLVGCGIYSFRGQGISGIKTIAVEPFDSRVAEYGLREAIQEALITRLLSDRVLKITTSGAADAILRGTITSFDDRPFTYQRDESVTERQIVVTLDVRLERPGQSEPLWAGTLVGEGNYPYRTGSPDERKEGIDRAIDRIALDLINGLTGDW